MGTESALRYDSSHSASSSLWLSSFPTPTPSAFWPFTISVCSSVWLMLTNCCTLCHLSLLGSFYSFSFPFFSWALTFMGSSVNIFFPIFTEWIVRIFTLSSNFRFSRWFNQLCTSFYMKMENCNWFVWHALRAAFSFFKSLRNLISRRLNRRWHLFVKAVCSLAWPYWIYFYFWHTTSWSNSPMKSYRLSIFIFELYVFACLALYASLSFSYY